MTKAKINLGDKYSNLNSVDNESNISSDNILIRSTILNVIKKGKKKETINNNDIYGKIKSQINTLYVE